MICLILYIIAAIEELTRANLDLKRLYGAVGSISVQRNEAVLNRGVAKVLR